MYQDTLDEMGEILIKYNDGPHVVIGGDMNASLLRNTSRDKLLKKFLTENHLKIPDKCGSDHTFHHYNGRDLSQIDYIIQNK